MLLEIENNGQVYEFNEETELSGSTGWKTG